MEIKDLTPEQLDKIAAGLVIPPDQLASMSSDRLARIIGDRLVAGGSESGFALSDDELDSVVGGRIPLTERLRTPGTLDGIVVLAKALGRADVKTDQIQKILVDTFCPNANDEDAVGIKSLADYFGHD
jgi:hypothetical protein